MTNAELIARFAAAERATHILRGAIRRLRPDTLDQHVQAHFKSLKAESEAVRRLPKLERDRIQSDIAREKKEQRLLAAAVAHFNVVGVGGVQAFIAEARETIESVRRDCSLSFPDDVLESLSPDGRVMLQLLRVQLQDRLQTASVTTLHATYLAAIKSQDAAGLVSAQIIEQLVASGHQLAASDADLPIVSQLRAYIEGMREMRLSTDLPNIEALATEVNRLDALCELVAVMPSDPATDWAASAAFDSESAAMMETGAPSNDDYVPASIEGAEAGAAEGAAS